MKQRVVYAKFGGGGLAPRHCHDVCVCHALILCGQRGVTSLVVAAVSVLSPNE